MKLDFSLDFIHYHLPVQLFIQFLTSGTLTSLIHAYKVWGGGKFLRYGTLQKLHKAKGQKTCHKVPTTSVQYRLKCKTGPLSFFQISFQSSNFAFVHFNPLNFRFIQLKYFRQILLKFFEKKIYGKYFSIINWIFF